LGIGLILLPLAFAGDSVEEEVEAAFYAYRDAIMSDRATEAATLLSPSTIDYYGRMRELALYADKDTLLEQSTMNLAQAMILRHSIPADDLSFMTGFDVIVHAIERGWIGKNSVAPFRVQDVHVTGDTAIIDVVSDRETGVGRMRMVRKDGRWTLDLLFIMEATGARFEAAAEKSGLSREEFILGLLAGLSGIQPRETIWNPPVQRREP
jgi:hypothetical protein